MIPYIDNIEKEFPEAITRTSPTPAAEYLFKVREEGGHCLTRIERWPSTELWLNCYFYV